MRARIPPRLEPRLGSLGAYTRLSLARAAALAARLHAEELAPEHWLAALLVDEDCAATRVVLHAFADPETIGVEVLAQCAGIMVVGSERTLPFSVRGVDALVAARARAHARGAARVEPLDVFLEAYERLRPELKDRLGRPAGLDEAARTAPAAPAGGADSGPLFRSYAPESLRALGASCRAAGGMGRDAIAPAHLVLGLLDVDEPLRAKVGLAPHRVRILASDLDEDPTPLPERDLAVEPRLDELLAALPPGASTLEVLGWILAHGSEEMVALLRRQKITSALVERCRGAFSDPEAS